MRKVQVTMNVLMVDDAAANGTYEQIHVYADANNVYEAAASAFQELMAALEETRSVPVVGCKTHCRCDNQDSSCETARGCRNGAEFDAK